MTTTDGSVRLIENPADFPEQNEIELIEEPLSRPRLWCRNNGSEPLWSCVRTSGDIQQHEYLTPERTRLVYELPLSEILLEFSTN